jgi:hypothetical protein
VQGGQRGIELVQLRFVRRVDQHQPAREFPAADVRRQQRLERSVTVALVHGDARVVAEVGLQRLGFRGVQFAASDAVVGAQRMRQQPWRTGVGVFAVRGAAGADRVEVASDAGITGGHRQQFRHTAFGLAGALCGVAIQRIQATAGMGVEREAGCRLAGQRVAHGQQHHMLEHVGMVAGMEGVAVIHQAQVYRPATMTEDPGTSASSPLRLGAYEQSLGDEP